MRGEHSKNRVSAIGQCPFEVERHATVRVEVQALVRQGWAQDVPAQPVPGRAAAPARPGPWPAAAAESSMPRPGIRLAEALAERRMRLAVSGSGHGLDHAGFAR